MLLVYIIILSFVNFSISTETKQEKEDSYESKMKLPYEPKQFRNCYSEIGCVEINEDWYHPKFRPINVEPLDRQTIKTEFLLMKSVNLTKREILYDLLTNHEDFINHTYNNKYDLIILIHDFTSNGETGWIKHITLSLLKEMKYNIISIDWEIGAEPPFHQAIANARVVSLEAIHFINKLKANFSLTEDKITIIGHGLGAHIAGYVGKIIKGIKKIIALDPTGPSFAYMPCKVKLTRRDAKYVEVLHTDSYNDRSQGTLEGFGHADFYINSAGHQPGCEEFDDFPSITAVTRNSLKPGKILPACSHKRSFKYYIESIQNHLCKFTGIKCENLNDIAQGTCTNNLNNNNTELHTFGLNEKIPIDIAKRNYYVLETFKETPYCLLSYKVNIFVEQSSVTSAGHFEILVIDDQNIFTNLSSTVDLKPGGNQYKEIFYAHTPKVLKIKEAKVKWTDKGEDTKMLPFNQKTIMVTKIVISPTDVNVESALCPFSKTAIIKSGSYLEFKPCNEAKHEETIKHVIERHAFKLNQKLHTITKSWITTRNYDVTENVIEDFEEERSVVKKSKKKKQIETRDSEHDLITTTTTEKDNIEISVLSQCDNSSKTINSSESSVDLNDVLHALADCNSLENSTDDGKTHNAGKTTLSTSERQTESSIENPKTTTSLNEGNIGHVSTPSTEDEHSDKSTEIGEHTDKSTEAGELADKSTEVGEHSDKSTEIDEHITTENTEQQITSTGKKHSDTSTENDLCDTIKEKNESGTSEKNIEQTKTSETPQDNNENAGLAAKDEHSTTSELNSDHSGSSTEHSGTLQENNDHSGISIESNEHSTSEVNSEHSRPSTENSEHEATLHENNDHSGISIESNEHSTTSEVNSEHSGPSTENSEHEATLQENNGHSTTAEVNSDHSGPSTENSENSGTLQENSDHSETSTTESNGHSISFEINIKHSGPSTENSENHGLQENNDYSGTSTESNEGFSTENSEHPNTSQHAKNLSENDHSNPSTATESCEYSTRNEEKEHFTTEDHSENVGSSAASEIIEHAGVINNNSEMSTEIPLSSNDHSSETNTEQSKSSSSNTGMIKESYTFSHLESTFSKNTLLDKFSTYTIPTLSTAEDEGCLKRDISYNINE